MATIAGQVSRPARALPCDGTNVASSRPGSGYDGRASAIPLEDSAWRARTGWQFWR
jgi:hypothetical protein